MISVKLYCPCKINMFLNIISKYPDNYHELNMINQTVSIYDEIEVDINKSRVIKITTLDRSIPIDEQNSINKAARTFFEYTNIHDYGVTVHLTKGIPNMAGLGGESVDAAGTLIALNECFRTNLPIKELMSIGLKVGSDVPYFIVGGYKNVQGHGEIVKKIGDNPYSRYLIIKPNISTMTREMFYHIDKLPFTKVIPNKNRMYNDFEKIAPEELLKYKKILLEYKALTAGMTGSGSSMVGVFANIHDEYQVRQKMKSLGVKVFTCNNVDGIRYIRSNK